MPRTSKAEATVAMPDHTLAMTETQRRELAAKLIQFGC